MKRFLLRTLLFLTPFLLALAYYLLLVDKDAMRGDIGRTRQTEFHYSKPTLDTSAILAPCRDAAADSVLPLSDDEIVLFGDSFSKENDRLWPGCRWHQFMGGKMGKRIVAMRYIDNVVDAYISTLVLHPERLSDTVIVESVERELVNRLCWIDFDNVEELHQERPGRTPSTLRGWWRKNRMKPVEYYQRKVGINVPVLKATLKEPVFSCRPDKLFYYADDTIQHSDWEIQTASANLQRLDSLSRAYGKTLFLVAIPDKYTAYHHLIDGADNSPRLLEDCPFDTLPCFINTLPAIRAEIEKGVADVYLPDDTHFSIPTAKATGEYVANQIISRP